MERVAWPSACLHAAPPVLFLHRAHSSHFDYLLVRSLIPPIDRIRPTSLLPPFQSFSNKNVVVSPHYQGAKRHNLSVDRSHKLHIPARESSFSSITALSVYLSLPFLRGAFPLLTVLPHCLPPPIASFQMPKQEFEVLDYLGAVVVGTIFSICLFVISFFIINFFCITKYDDFTQFEKVPSPVPSPTK